MLRGLHHNTQTTKQAQIKPCQNERRFYPECDVASCANAILRSNALKHLNLELIGFQTFFEQQINTLEPNQHIARISQATRGHYQLLISAQDEPVDAIAKAHLQGVVTTGDWVIYTRKDDRVLIEHMLERKTTLARARAGDTRQSQIVAANVDTIFIVTSMNQEFNASRLERYLVAVWNSGASPVIVLNKSDLPDNPSRYIDMAESLAMGVPVVAVSALEQRGQQALIDMLKPGKTYALIGSSGVGKSTIHNWLLGAYVAKTQDIRTDDDEGRHTTTHRYLTLLPQGAILMDTPGMREFGLWFEQEDGLEHTFRDIEALTEQCRFRDCSHQQEPGCAINQAIEDGELDERRLRNYQKLLREMAYQEQRQSKSREAERQHAKMIRAVQKQSRQHKRR